MKLCKLIVLLVFVLSVNAEILSVHERNLKFEIGMIEFTAAFGYDSNADGFIDSIVIEYSGVKLQNTDSSLIMERITLPFARNFAVNSFVTTDSSVVLRVTENRDIPATSTSSEDRINIREDTISGRLFISGASIRIRDKIAPVIVDARVVKQDIGDDTLIVTFSEPIQRIAHLQVFTFVNNGTEYGIVLESLNNNGTNVYKGIVKSQSGPLEQNDQVWIDTASLVRDIIGIEQGNPENRRVPLFVDYGNLSVRFTDAFYFDRDGNGFVDEIRLYYIGQLDYSERLYLRDRIILPQSRNLRLVEDPLSGTEGVLILRVEEIGEEPYTNVLSGDTISFLQGDLPGNGYLVGSTLKIQDRMAPVIRSAHLDSYGNGVDTFRVIFSEPIKPFASLQPFRFIKPDLFEYEVQMRENAAFYNNDYTSAMRAVLYGRQMQEQDSVWIQVLMVDVYDMEGNLQRTECNRRVNLTITYYFSWRVIAENNPFTKRNGHLPEVVRSAYSESGNEIPQDGVVIIVEPDRNLREKIPVSGTVSIYDAVNNIVVKKQKLVASSDQTRLFYVWDGANYNGRKVGSGTYLGIVRVVYNGKEYKKPINLGVKR